MARSEDVLTLGGFARGHGLRPAARLLLIGAAALAGISCRDPRFRLPRLRPQPTQFLHLSGRIDPPLDVSFEIEYHTYDDACRVTTSFLEGASSPGIYHHRVSGVRQGNSYQVSLPLDLVAEQACKWQAFSVNYVVTIDGKAHQRPLPPTPLVWFNDDSPLSLPPFVVTCTQVRGMLSTGLVCERPSGEYFLRRGQSSLTVHFALRSAPSRT